MTDERVRDSMDVYDEGFDLSALLAVPWKHRRLIGFGTLVVTLVAVVYSLLAPRVYLSEGFYQLGNPKTREDSKTRDDSKTWDEPKSRDDSKRADLIGIPIPLFKTSATQFSNPNRLQTFASQDQSLTEEDRQNIKRVFRTAADVNRWIRPVYAYARDDARDFVQLTKDDNAAIGLNLTYEAASPQAASLYVGLLGRYVRDCLVYVTLFTYIMDESSDASSELSENENQTLNAQFALEQNVKKMRDIQAILAKYPESARIENRQLLSIQDGGYRYLSPVTQLVGIESAVADQRRRLASLDRTRERLMIRQRYFSRCIAEMKKIGVGGEEILQMLKTTRSQVFTETELAKGSVKEALNELLIDTERFELAFNTNCRFISGPTVPVRHIRPSGTAIVSSAFLASFVLLVLFAFVSSWWATNKRKILAGNSR